MKYLIQISLALWLVSTAVAQESPTPTPARQEQQKTLRVYDWKDLQQRHELSAGEVITMDGTSVLKIGYTNNAPLDTNNPPLEVSLLKISDPSVIKKTYFLVCEVKCENVRQNVLVRDNGLNTRGRIVGVAGPNGSFLGRGGRRNGNGVFDIPVFANLELLCRLPPSAPGGDEHTVYGSVVHGTERIYGTSNWRLCQFEVHRSAFEGLPTQLELNLYLPGSGTIYLRPIKLVGIAGSWWSPQQSGLFGGIGGSLIGCLGGLIGWLVSKGRARNFVVAAVKCLIALGVLLTVAGLVAAVLKQPYAVWYALLLPGVILVLVFSLNLHSIQRRYDELEIRRMTSIDATGS